MRSCIALALALWIGSVAAAGAANASPGPAGTTTCEAPQFHMLDFWRGTWRVTVGKEYAGTDIVSREAGGCALTERWADADGGQGYSLFFFDSFAGRWQQIWVSDRATQAGGLKYKTLVATFPDGGVRFAGILPSPPGTAPVLDRTTLTPLRDGTVHQVIEISKDGGQTWIDGFDAIYHRQKD